jgi:small-conductance mechanosensitive channel
VSLAALLQAFGDLFASRGSKYLGSAVVLAVFLVLLAAVYAVGPGLKDRFDGEAAEAVQSGLVTVAGIVAGALLVGIWGETARVIEAMAEVQVGPREGVRALIVLVALGVAYTVTRITKRLVHISEGRDAITIHQREVLHHVVQIIVFLPAILFSLRLLFDVAPENLILGAGAVSLIVGLAARQTLASVLAGFVLLFSRPFEVGDWVLIDDHEGIVTDVTIFTTRLRTFDEEHVMIPNDDITDSAVTNRSKNRYLRVEVEVGVDYDTDVERAAQVALAAMEGVDEVDDRREPDVVIDRFGDSAVVVKLRFWIDRPSIRRKWDARNAVIEAVKTAFEDEGIAIPFPQRVLAGREAAGGLHVRTDVDGSRSPATDGESAGAENGDDGSTTADTGDGGPATPDDGDAGATTGDATNGESTASEPSSDESAAGEPAPDDPAVEPAEDDATDD